MPKLLGLLNRGTIRTRLTAWYVVLLALVLVVFSGYLYLRLESNLADQVDAALQVAASQVLPSVDEGQDHPAFRKAEAFQVVARRLVQAGFVVRLTAPDGTPIDGLGDYPAVPVWTPDKAGYTTLTEEETDWRLYGQPIQTPDGRVIGWLQVARSLGSVQDALEALYSQILLGLPLVLILAGLGGHFLADRALRPIDRITQTAEAIGADDLARRIAYQGPADEVGRLAATFDRMLDRLQAAFERERRFTADTSHELRTPLTALKGRIDVTLSRARTTAEHEEALRAMQQEVDRLIRLSTDLLFLARLDQGRLSRKPEILDLSDLLGAAVDGVRPLAEAKGLRLVEEVPAGLQIQGDPDHLIRLILNLLDNAIKYTPTGGLVTLRAEDQGTRMMVAVSDTGPGIPPEHLPHLFERFYRVEADRSSSAGGAGLGLAVAHEIARWHGGTLEVKSELGRGTTFTIHSPVQAPQAPPVPPEPQPAGVQTERQVPQGGQNR